MYSTKTKQEQAFSADQSASLNHAYNVLKMPHLRATYLLNLEGINVLEEIITDMKLLTEVLDIRETIEATESQVELRLLKDANDKKINACVEKLKIHFANKNLKSAQEITIQLHYWMKINDELESRMNSE